MSNINIYDFLRDMLRTQLHFECIVECTHKYIMECRVHKSTRPALYCRVCESILDLIWIFSLHFDIRLLDFVTLAYATERRLSIGNS